MELKKQIQLHTLLLCALALGIFMVVVGIVLSFFSELTNTTYYKAMEWFGGWGRN
jgi:hypothetical protein